MKKKSTPQFKCPWCGRMLTPHKGRVPRHVQSAGLQCVGIGQPTDSLPSPREAKIPFRPFRCECGGMVRLLAGQGRTREYKRGVRMQIPDDFLLPTCAKCGETFWIPEISNVLDAILEKQYRATQREKS